jgi:signal transduction histidine kinase
MQKILVDLPPFIQELSPTQNQFFEKLLLAVPTQQGHSTAKEERKIRKEIDNHLSANGIHNAQELADIFTDIGIFQVQNYVNYLKEDESKNTLQMTYEIANVNKSMQTILSATEKASKVVFALKSYAHQDQHEQKSLFSCIQTIDNVLTIYSNQLKQGITVVKHYDEDIAILCYPDELMQVWTNLIHNAIQAMNHQGTLTIATISKKDAVEIQITDTGGGIPVAIQDKIFNAFFTTKKLGEGTGLGLDIVKKIVTKHNGKIWFQSIEGEGTTFFVEIPR